MDAVYIPNLLQAPEKTRVIEVDTYFPELGTLTPVRGEVTVTHQGNYLAIKGRGETIVTLTCDRCLRNYNQRLAIEPQELIWLQATPEGTETYSLEQEVPLEDLVETLPPDGYFSPQTWLYEQLCLALPPQRLCDPNCAGIQAEVAPADEPSQLIDHRWAALADLKRYLPDEN